MNEFFSEGGRLLSYVEGLWSFLPDHHLRFWAIFSSLFFFVWGCLWSGRLVLKALSLDDPAAKRIKADDFVQKGRFREARSLYEKLGAFSKAAEMALKMEDLEGAIELAQRAKNWEFLGKIFVRLNRLEEAAQAYDQARHYVNAGVYWEKIGKLEIALDRYQKGGHRRKVEELLTLLERYEDLGKLHEQDFETKRARLGEGSTPQELENVRSFATRAANAYRRVRQFKKAFELYMKSDQTLEAARCLEECGELLRSADLYFQAGQGEDAARLFIRAGQYDRAADIFEELGKADEVPRLLEMAGRKDEAKAFSARLALEQGDEARSAELFEEAGEFEAAAKLFFELGSWEKAAELFVKIGDYTEAAKTNVKGENHASAAPLFSKMGHHTQAANSYEIAGKPKEAADEYVNAGRFFEAARLTEEHLDDRSAISLYQKVSKDAPEWEHATHALARLFWKKGKVDLAKDKFEVVCRGKILDQTNLELFYDFATFLEGSGNLKKASEIYEDILAFDFHFKDVLTRMDAVLERLRSTTSDSKAGVSAPSESFSPFLAQPGAIVAERYQLHHEIGRGAMGVIFHAEDRKLGREVALKFFVGQDTHDPESQKTILQEAKLVAHLNHANIVGIYDAGKHRDQLYLVMEFVDGLSLADWLKQKEQLSWEEAKNVLFQILDGLDYAHARDIVHRDIKTANLLLGKTQAVKILDFGLARMLRQGHLAATQTVGSPYYMAPEQIQGDRYDHRVDLYSTGVVAFEILTGKLPFVEGEVTYHHVHTPAPALGLNHPALEEMIQKALAKNPDQRFQTAKEFKQALEQVPNKNV